MSEPINEHTLAGYVAFDLDADWVPPLSTPERHAALYAKEIVRLRASLSAARTDAERLDWLTAEFHRVDPMAVLTVKQAYERKSGTWVDAGSPPRAMLDACRTMDAARSAALRGPSETENG